jgi:hypothetical protein
VGNFVTRPSPAQTAVDAVVKCARRNLRSRPVNWTRGLNHEATKRAIHEATVGCRHLESHETVWSVLRFAAERTCIRPFVGSRLEIL